MGAVGASVNDPSRGKRDRERDRLVRSPQGCLAVLRRKCQAFRPHERHVPDAEEAEQEPQVRIDKLGWRSRRILPTSRQCDDDLLAVGKPLGAPLGIAEGFACNGDAVNPGLP
jgi:hypothetical protein